jgi:hypothetical protein
MQASELSTLSSTNTMIEIPASHMETSTDDVDMLSSTPMSTPNTDHPSVASKCTAFQSRIDSVRLPLLNPISRHH